MPDLHIQLRKSRRSDWVLNVDKDVSLLFTWQARELYRTVMAAELGEVQIGPFKVTLDAAQLARLKDYFSMFGGALA